MNNYNNKTAAWLRLCRIATLTALATASCQAFAECKDPSEDWDSMIVSFKKSSPEYGDNDLLQEFLTKLGSENGVHFTRLRRLALGADVIHLDTPIDRTNAEAIIRKIANNSSVEYAEMDERMWPTLTPNDTKYKEQWQYFESKGGINLPLAWDKSTGSGVVVAVLDTGITSHSDLNINVLSGYDFISDIYTANDGNGRDASAVDPGDGTAAGGTCGGGAEIPSSWHGTHVAGTVAAVTNNTTGVAGVGYKAKILPVRVLGKEGGAKSDIADAIVWAAGGAVPSAPSNVNPAEVINMSLGGSGACSKTYQDAIDFAVSKGVVVVVAGGNDNADAANKQPASCNNVIAVGANDRQGNRASYSNYGTTIDISAPGGETDVSLANGIWSTFNTGTVSPSTEGYNSYQGTSMAAPHVSGVVALMQSILATSPAAVESTIKSTARKMPGTCSVSGGCGTGIIDALAVLTKLTTPPPTTPNCADQQTKESGTAHLCMEYRTFSP